MKGKAVTGKAAVTKDAPAPKFHDTLLAQASAPVNV